MAAAKKELEDHWLSTNAVDTDDSGGVCKRERLLVKPEKASDFTQSFPKGKDTGKPSSNSDILRGSFDKWSRSRCEFTCPTEGCGINFGDASSFAAHSLLRHGTTHDSFDVFLDRGRSRWTRCNVCREQVPHYHPKLGDHMTKEHNMSLWDYYCKYVLDIAIQEVKAEEEAVGRSSDCEEEDDQVHDDNGQEQNCGRVTENEEQQASPKQVVSSKRWSSWKKCVFQCDVCKYRSRCLRSLENHRKHKHKDIDDKARLFKDVDKFISEAASHTCKICGESVWQNTTLLQLHFNQCHRDQKMNLDKYFSLPERKISIFTHKRFVLKKLQIKLRRTVPIYNLKALKEAIQTVPYVSMFRSRGRNLDKSKCTDLVENLCKFQCEGCSFTSDKSTNLAIHRRKCHGNQIKTAAPPQCVIEARYHWCTLCQLGVLCDRAIISTHLVTAHESKVGLLDYILESQGKLKFPNFVTGLEEVHLKKRRRLNMDKDKRELNKRLKQVPILPFEKMTLPPLFYPHNMLTDVADDLCLFRCFKCFWESRDLNKAVSHLKMCVGSGSITSEAVKEARYFLCTTCGCQILCSKHVIRHHKCGNWFRLGLKRAKKRSQNLARQKCKVILKRLPVYVVTDSSGKVMVSILSKANAIDKAFILVEPESYPIRFSITHDVNKKSLFYCKICHYDVKSARRLLDHISSSLHGDIDQDPGQYFIAKRMAFHFCKICFDIIHPCDRTSIHGHVAKRHHIDLKLYTELEPSDVTEILNVHCIQRAATTNYLNLSNPNKVKIKPFNWFVLTPSELPADLTISSVEDKCIFECPKCLLEVKQMKDLFCHFRNTGHGKVSYSKNFVKEAIYHACRVCSRRILADTLIIASHVKGVHGKGLDWYKVLQEKTNNNDSEKLCNKLSVNNGSTISIKDLALRKEVPLVHKDTISGFIPCKAFHKRAASELFDTQVTNKIGNICSFTCSKCHIKCLSWFYFRKHLRHCVGNVTFLPAYVTEARYHKCAVCFAKILCDRYIIACHLSGKHKISISKYMTFLMRSGQDMDNSNFLERYYHYPKSRPGDEKSTEPQPSKEERKWRLQLSTTALTDTPGKTFCRKFYPSTLTPSLCTDFVGNLCSFTCTKCQRRFFTSYYFKIHARECMGRSTFNSMNLLEARYHTCGLCRAQILCDIDLIRSHLSSYHCTWSFAEYVRHQETKTAVQ